MNLSKSDIRKLCCVLSYLFVVFLLISSPLFAQHKKATIYHKGWIDFNKNGSKDIYEDPTQPIDKRVADLLSQMNVNEKSMQLTTLYGYGAVLKDQLPTADWKNEVWKDGIANIDEQLNGLRHPDDLKNVYPYAEHTRAINKIQAFFVEETRLGIPVDFTNEGIRGLNHYKATFFPAEIGVASTWNTDLVRKIGQVTGKEAKALGYTNIYSPVLDLARDPRWGRTVETYGEDPYLVSQLGKQQVLGIQENGVMSTAKHYAVYGVPIGGRDGDVRTHPHVSRHDVFTLHLEPFRLAIHEAGGMGVMASYNSLDGVPVAADSAMMNGILRAKWLMKGYIVSDSDAVEYIYNKHRVSETYEEGIARWLWAGGNVRTNFTPPKNFVLPLRKAIREGIVNQEVLDQRVSEVLRTKFLLGLFDSPYVENEEAANTIVAQKSHKELAKQAALESIILLKNDSLKQGSFLPLNKKDLNTIAVIGPLANNTEAVVSRYGPVEPDLRSVLEGIQNYVGDKVQVLYEKGVEVRDQNFPKSDVLKEEADQQSLDGIKRAQDIAAKADVVVLCLGDDHKSVGEFNSRLSLDFAGYQKELMQAVAEVNPNIVLVMLNGRPITANWANKHIPAIIEAWYPGEFTGEAITDVIFGEYNPGGRLPITFPASTGQIPFAFPFEPGGDASGHARVREPLYAFGYGLSYTNFEYSDLNVKVVNHDLNNPKVSVEVTVKNTGDSAGDEVVQLYLNDEVSSTITYNKVLRGFKRIHLKVGERKKVAFELGIRDLGFYTQELDFIVEKGAFKVWVSKSSREDILEAEFEL